MFLFKKTIIRISIDFNFAAKKEGKSLSVHQSNTPNIDINNIKLIEEIREVILRKLPCELKKSYNLDVSTRITNEMEGSIIIILSAMVGIYVFISGYKNFRESCRMIKDDLESLLDNTLRKYSTSLESRVVILSPSELSNIDELTNHGFVTQNNHTSYFMPMVLSIILNLLLAFILFRLIWHAINIIYF